MSTNPAPGRPPASEKKQNLAESEPPPQKPPVQSAGSGVSALGTTTAGADSGTGESGLPAAASPAFSYASNIREAAVGFTTNDDNTVGEAGGAQDASFSSPGAHYRLLTIDDTTQLPDYIGPGMLDSAYLDVADSNDVVSIVEADEIRLDTKADGNGVSNYLPIEDVAEDSGAEGARGAHTKTKSSLVHCLGWNEAFQRALDHQDVIAISHISTDFAEIARLYAKLIISEMHLPPAARTLQPVNIGGTAGGDKFIARGILFKLVTDPVIDLPNGRRVWIYGSTKPRIDLASKSAAAELRGANAYSSAFCRLSRVETQVRVPLQVMVDYAGHRVLCMPILPIKGETTLLYGGDPRLLKLGLSGDAKAARQRVDAAADLIHLAPHQTPLSRGQTIRIAADNEVHRGFDGRVYILDMARSLPPQHPMGAPHLLSDKQSFLYRFFRAEYLQRAKKEGRPALSTDCRTRFQGSDKKKHIDAALKATQHLVGTVVPELAQALDAGRYDWLGVLSESKDATKMMSFCDKGHRLALRVCFIAESIPASHGDADAKTAPQRPPPKLRLTRPIRPNGDESEDESNNISVSSNALCQRCGGPLLRSDDNTGTTGDSVRIPGCQQCRWVCCEACGTVPMRKVRQRDVSSILHSHGINIHHIGLLRSHVRSTRWADILFIEIVARCLKHMVRAEGRRVLRACRGLPSSSEISACVIKILNGAWNADEDSKFCARLRAVSREKFGPVALSALSPSELQDAMERHRARVLTHTIAMCGLQFAHDTPSDAMLQREVWTPDDFLPEHARVRSLGLTSFALAYTQYHAVVGSRSDISSKLMSTRAYERAAAAQEPHAVAWCAGRGVGVCLPHRHTEMKLNRELSGHGDTVASFELGLRLAEIARGAQNSGTTRTITGMSDSAREAASIFKALAEKGHPLAQCNMARCYLEGLGVPVDAKRAVLWLQKSADAGCPEAMTSLGQCRERGRGLAKNPQIAAALYADAAKLGDAQAQHRLGRLYWYGIGVDRDMTEALHFFRLAAKQGHTGADSYARAIRHIGQRGMLPDFKSGILERVDLSGLRLGEVPWGLGHRQQLWKLSLINNKISSLSDEVGTLQGLKILDLEGNNLTSLPAALGKLRSLRILNLSDNRIRILPGSIGELKELRVLDVDGNPLLSSLPQCIASLPLLTELECEPALQNSSNVYSYWARTVIDLSPDVELGRLRRRTMSRALSNGSRSMMRSSPAPSTPIPGPRLQLTPSLSRTTSTNPSFSESTESLSSVVHRTSTIPQEAFDAKALRVLRLDHHHLRTVSPSIARLKGLQIFSASHNRIKSIAREIRKLAPTLRVLNLAGNPISRLPSEIGKLVALEELRLAGTALTSVPSSIGRLCRLETLELGLANSCASLPDSLGELSLLRTLRIHGPVQGRKARSATTKEQAGIGGALKTGRKTSQCSAERKASLLTKLPESLYNLVALRTFDLSYTAVKRMPKGFGKWKRLRRLLLRSNALVDLPESIGVMRGLVELRLSRNMITELPAAIGRLTRLEMLDLVGNPLGEDGIPPELWTGCGAALRRLSLRRCELQSLPNAVRHLKRLKDFDASDNQFFDLPVEIGELKSLRKINVSKNSLLSSLPVELCALEGLGRLAIDRRLAGESVVVALRERGVEVVTVTNVGQDAGTYLGSANARGSEDGTGSVAVRRFTASPSLLSSSKPKKRLKSRRNAEDGCVVS